MMKSRFVTSVLPILGLLSLTACDPGTGSPKDVLSSAAIALQNNKFDDFQKLLSGDALAQYGNMAAFQKLQQELSGYTNISSDDAKLIRVQEGDEGAGQYGDILRIYTVNVYGTPANGSAKQLYSTEVTCKVWAELYTPPEQCSVTPNQGETCFQPAPEINQYEDCSIDELK